LDRLVIRAGILGVSEGNGHPFSFAAIANGFDDAAMADAGWPVIHAYLRQRDASEFGRLGLRVTHAWTQCAELTERLCRACRIPHAVEHPESLLGAVDVIILARDDAERHHAMAMPFLEAGLPTFVDKPLTLEPLELAAFLPYLESGRLMSCSGMRFARELDEPRAELQSFGELRLIRGAILNDWDRYGIHLIDAVLGMTSARPLSVTPLPSRHHSVAIALDDGSTFQLDALGDVGACFRLDLFGTGRIASFNIRDNFSMFRRLLFHFARSVREERAAVPPADTVAAIRLLIAGRRALAEERTVSIDAIGL
jgi:predicted dehydrogenase